VASREFPAAGFDPSRPHIARVYDYLLGGKDNFEADRTAGDQIIASLPAVQVGVRAQRAVLGRVVRYLVGEAGVRQLIDIGSGAGARLAARSGYADRGRMARAATGVRRRRAQGIGPVAAATAGRAR
jgi:hypothetical protein